MKHMSVEEYLAKRGKKPRAKADGGIVGPMIKALNQIPGCFAFRVHCGRVYVVDPKTKRGYWIHLAPGGTPDIFGIINGRPFALECKCLTGKPSAVQLRRHKKLFDCGVWVHVPRTVVNGVEFVLQLDRVMR